MGINTNRGLTKHFFIEINKKKSVSEYCKKCESWFLETKARWEEEMLKCMHPSRHNPIRRKERWKMARGRDAYSDKMKRKLRTSTDIEQGDQSHQQN